MTLLSSFTFSLIPGACEERGSYFVKQRSTLHGYTTCVMWKHFSFFLFSSKHQGQPRSSTGNVRRGPTTWRPRVQPSRRHTDKIHKHLKSIETIENMDHWITNGPKDVICVGVKLHTQDSRKECFQRARHCSTSVEAPEPQYGPPPYKRENIIIFIYIPMIWNCSCMIQSCSTVTYKGAIILLYRRRLTCCAVCTDFILSYSSLHIAFHVVFCSG